MNIFSIKSLLVFTSQHAQFFVFYTDVITYIHGWFFALFVYGSILIIVYSLYFYPQKAMNIFAIYSSCGKYIKIIGFIIIAIIGNFLLNHSFAQSGNVPVEYYPNYEIQTDWETLIEYFVQLEASNNVGTELPESLFRDMSDIFIDIFEYFPQSSSNEIIYRQCGLITKELAKGVTRSRYVTFKDKCFGPLGKIIKEINAKSTVKADIKANPTKGSAPLNVTFDARASVDPSIATIPDENFFWYYRDTFGVDQVIGRGQVVNHTFLNPGKHIVHLTVRSSNNFRDGVFDGTDDIDINVAPKAANMVVYINGKQATKEKLLKIGSQDAKEGVLIDATATVPIGARTIVEHQWIIKSTTDQSLNETIPGPGNPSQFIYQFPRNGVFTISLEIVDNESNKLKETYSISVSDPVSSIKFKPEKGTTSTEFIFDASASYSITSRIRKYQRTITDPDGKQIDVVEAKEIKRKFNAPGTYNVKLTVTDEQGASSFDSQQFFVGSTPPVPSFIIEPQSERKFPSQFVLDASGSFDEDVRSGKDSLKYEWFFPNSKVIEIDRTLEEDGSKIRISVNEPGKYKTRLVVQDSFGERQEVEKEIEVKSTLRPEVLVSPLVGIRGEPVTFVAKVNKPVAFYDWNFGDGKKQQTKDPKVEHIFPKAGPYKVTLTVTTQENETNEINSYIFMGQKDSPVVAYTIKDPKGGHIQLDSSCDVLSGTELTQIPAFTVTRYENITIDAGISTNAQGENRDTKITFHPKNDQTYDKQNLSYNFPELGCSYIDLYVDDSNVGKTSTDRIMFNVKNALPQLENITLTFPQTGGGNPVGVGANTQSLSNDQIFSDPSIASVIVKVQAKGARDPDGFISHYRWFYYPSDDPSRKEGFKITPSDVPYVTFIIPKPPYATEYSFGLELIDNDDGRISSKDVVGNGPVIFFPPGENSLDVPIVTLTIDKQTTRVGEEVTFSTISSILSERPDFDATRYFKYDFDGDGIYDIPSTKNDKVKHTYTKAGSYNPKVSVFYRGRAGVGTTEPITVLKGLKPIFVVSTDGTKALIKDFSIGDIIETTFCMDTTNKELCEGEDSPGIKKNESVFMYDFENPGQYLVKLDVTDEFGNIQNARRSVVITEKTDQKPGILSLPEGVNNNDGDVEITITNESNNSVDIYLNREGKCFLDTDITSDGNGDGDPAYDEDIVCNSLENIKLYPKNKTQNGRLYYVNNNKIEEIDIIFAFLDIEEVEVAEEWKEVYNQINDLITETNFKADDSLGRFYVDLLINLKASLGENDGMSGIIIQLRDLIESNPTLLDEEQNIKASALINALSNSLVQSAFGGTTYDIAKKNILVRFQGEDLKSATSLFAKFEQQQGNQDEMKGTLDQILTLAGSSRSRGEIDEIDFNYMKKNLCDIIVYFDLPSVSCGTIIDIDSVEVDTPGGDNSKSGRSTLAKVLIVFLRIFLGLFIVAGGFIFFYALKAKRRRDAEQEQSE